MKTLRCIIADDEPIARKIVENYCADIPYIEVISSCKNAFEVMDILQKQPIDLLFLDINMPKLSGLSMLKTLQQKPAVIITTAYSEYAVEGFALSVTDYLLKPFSLERFLQAISKVQNTPNSPQEITLPEKEKTTTSIFVKSDKKLIKLNFDAINYIEAYGNYIKIHTDKMTLVSETLSNFLEKLPENFVRIHKSFIINFDQLKLIDGNRITLISDSKLPIGKSYRKDVLDRI